MDIDAVQELQSAGFHLVEHSAWISINDDRPEFRQVFATARLGKIQDGHLYVTLRALNTAARRLMATYGFHISDLKTSNGSDDTIYPGFDLGQCSAATLAGFVKDLQTVVGVELNASGV